ncbi:hypothetical protein [Acidiphilium iwatense]|uniref:hypothetical protein n=1 Tax=Acidiphilium iwatense TaxID=768198 RepID=UPI001F26A7A9|nr:hypothetical protein [Acidiphilium iwatense]
MFENARYHYLKVATGNIGAGRKDKDKGKQSDADNNGYQTLWPGVHLGDVTPLFAYCESGQAKKEAGRFENENPDSMRSQAHFSDSDISHH